MNKYIKIGIFTFLGVLVAGLLAWLLLMPPNHEPTTGEVKLTILDRQGNVLVKAADISDIYEQESWAYLELVVAEAFNGLALTAEPNTYTYDALFLESYTIHTNFDSQAFLALQKAGRSVSFDTGSALTDLNGNLLAVYSSGVSGDNGNLATKEFAPYSAFSPLSVYAPALEAGKIHWSSFYEDSPYKQITDAEGETLDWPANRTGVYSQENVTVYKAFQTALNTVAVKVMADVGVEKGISFLQDKLDMALPEAAYAEDALGGIALGYLERGVTPIQMAGYYQIFANGGKYTQPKTVAKITDASGAVKYTRPSAYKQAISSQTADVMNRLLQGVVAAGGIGTQAKCPDVPVAGQIGTDKSRDNWFVGVTPGYSLAIWHGENSANQAPALFSAVVEALYHNQPNANRNFITHSNLQNLIYCAKSGMVMSPLCSSIEEGYYSENDVPEMCNQCGTAESTSGGEEQ